MSIQPYILNDLKSYFLSKATLPRLIIINTAVWLLVSAILVIAFLFNIDDNEVRFFIADILGVSANLERLIVRPWTIFTYMFLHISFFHILFNMLWLYWFGKIFLEFLVSRQLLVTYILGGLAGGLLYVLAYNIFPAFSEILVLSTAIGASAAVMAIVTTISFYVPNYTIPLFLVGRVKIVYVAIILFVLDFFMIRSGNSGGHIAHIGGAIYGFIYAYYLRKGKDFSNFFEAINLNGIRRFFMKPSGNSKASYKAKRPVSDVEYNNHRMDNQKRIDIILDKISKSGYDSLTKAEKEFLFKSSNKN